MSPFIGAQWIVEPVIAPAGPGASNDTGFNVILSVVLPQIPVPDTL